MEELTTLRQEKSWKEVWDTKGEKQGSERRKIRCGSYLRISKEDKEEGESNSLSNQRKLIELYLQEHKELDLCYEWLDDGVSGSHFQRPGVQKLFQAVEQKKVDCILVKDLSRFGREYIETGYYLQEFFPAHQVRFIAVCDGYDSAVSEFMEQNLLVPILNILNDSYCQDISRKVRMQQMIKRKEGAYIGAFCVYGYQKDVKDRNHLVIDEPAAEVVRMIFALRLGGGSPEKISSLLNEAGISSPYQYKKLCQSQYVSGFVKEEKSRWHPTAVRRILQNETYTGVVVQGKKRKVSYKLPLREKVPKKDWVRVEGMHDPIVTREIFEMAQQPLWQLRKEGADGKENFVVMGTDR